MSSGPTPAEFAALGDEYADVYESTRGLTLSSSLPGSGTPTYTGVMYIVDDFGVSTEGMLGSLTVAVDFANTTVDGTANGFYAGTIDSSGTIAGEGRAVDGEITFLSSAAVGGGTFFAPLDGALEIDEDGVVRDITGGDIELFFLDNPTTALRGGSTDITFDGSATSPNAIVYAD
ncbi:hypothetical protein GQ651_07785 [Alphaproteobacteria bacterium GH1-50]|uniref:Uncharacterized protein n=1 Tax=Kangsaoukella pontilimi TaxID=2691042 RepID=A0A7C9IFQ7_9RHOB|nr:hypothetical protein [Kangsaoukella pontilimi]